MLSLIVISYFYNILGMTQDSFFAVATVKYDNDITARSAITVKTDFYQIWITMK